MVKIIATSIAKSSLPMLCRMMARVYVRRQTMMTRCKISLCYTDTVSVYFRLSYMKAQSMLWIHQQPNSGEPGHLKP
jgi:hypothetical protein